MPGEAFKLRGVVEVDTKTGEQSLDSLGKKVTSFGDSFKQGLGIGAGIEIMSKGFQAIGSVVGSLQESVIGFNQQLDMSKAIFTRYFEGNSQLADAFINKLKAFSAETPFEFKDLSSLAVRLSSVGVAANDIIPTIKAIGNAASASGSLSSESIGRIGLAIQQMIGKGKVSAEEMNQLIEGGVTNAWQILAKEVGVTEAQVRKMTEAGEISGETMVRALRKSYEEAGLMEQASKSLTGALSTIKDVSTQAFAEMGRSIFELATEGANALAKFLSTEQFQIWVRVGKNAIDGLVGGFRGLLTALEPIGKEITAAFNFFTEGNFAAGFGQLGDTITIALDTVFQTVTSFASSMLGAGENLVGEYAAGIMNGAQNVLQTAIDFVAETIAAFLIGESPPPDGPLAAIRQGGANTIAAWGEGAESAADDAVKPAAEKIKGGLDSLKEAGRGVDETIRDIGKSISDIDSQTRDVKSTIDDVTDAYKDQLKPLEDQLKTLTNVKDMEAERHKMALDIEEAQLRQAMVAAQGDPAERARLQTLLDQLKSNQDNVKLQREMDDLRKSGQGSEKDRLKDQLEANKLIEQERELREKLSKAKPEERARIEAQIKELEVRKQIAAAEAKERQESLARKDEDIKFRTSELEIRQQLDAMVDKNAVAEIKNRQEAIKAEREQMQLAEAQAKLERETLALPIRQEIERIKQEHIATLEPLKEQLESLSKQKADLTEQRQAQQAIKQEIQAAASALRDQETAQKAAAKAAKEAAAATPKAPTDKSFSPDEAAETAIKNAKEKGAQLATNIRDGFFEWITANPLITGASIAGVLFGAGQGAALGASLGSVVPVIGTVIGGVLGAGIGAAVGGLGASYLAGLLQNKLGEIFGTAAPGILKDFQADLLSAWNAGGPLGVLEVIGTRFWAAITAMVPMIAQRLSVWTQAIVDWAVAAAPPFFNSLQKIIDKLYQWIGESARAIGPKLKEWELAFIDWARTTGLSILSQLAELAGDILDWIGANAKVFAGQLLDWATEFVAWIGPASIEMLEALGLLLADTVEWIASHTGDLIDALAKWALEFVEWVGPKVLPLLAELGKLLVKMVDWAVNTALPAIAKKLAEWGLAFVEWVGPRIVPMLTELGKLLAKLSDWFLKEALPEILIQLGKWSLAFIDWIAPVLRDLPENLVKIGAAIGDWIKSKVTPSDAESFNTLLLSWVDAFTDWPQKAGMQIGAALADKLGINIGKWITDYARSIVDSAKAIGQGMLEGIQRGMSDNWDRLKDWIEENIGRRLPEWMQKILGIHSPSRVFAEMGENLILGLIQGMERRSGELLETARKLMDFSGIGGGTGPGMDLIRQIGELASGIGGPEFARAAMAISASETGGGTHLSEIGGTGAQGPFQFDPGGELRNFARALGVSLEEAGMIARTQPMLAAQWALEGYLGSALRAGIAQGLSGASLAVYGSRYGQRPREGLEVKAGEWWHQLFGMQHGGIVLPRDGGTLARLAEGGRAEAVIPLTQDMRNLGTGGSLRGETHRFVVQDPTGRTLAEWYVTGRIEAIKQGRVKSEAV